MVSPILQVKPIRAARRMRKQHINLVVIPRILVRLSRQLADPQLQWFQRFDDSCNIVPETLKQQNRLPVEALNHLVQCLQFAAVDLYH